MSGKFVHACGSEANTNEEAFIPHKFQNDTVGQGRDSINMFFRIPQLYYRCPVGSEG